MMSAIVESDPVPDQPILFSGTLRVPFAHVSAQQRWRLMLDRTALLRLLRTVMQALLLGGDHPALRCLRGFLSDTRRPHPQRVRSFRPQSRGAVRVVVQSCSPIRSLNEHCDKSRRRLSRAVYNLRCFRMAMPGVVAGEKRSSRAALTAVRGIDWTLGNWAPLAPLAFQVPPRSTRSSEVFL